MFLTTYVIQLFLQKFCYNFPDTMNYRVKQWFEWTLFSLNCLCQHINGKETKTTGILSNNVSGKLPNILDSYHWQRDGFYFCFCFVFVLTYAQWFDCTSKSWLIFFLSKSFVDLISLSHSLCNGKILMSPWFWFTLILNFFNLDDQKNLSFGDVRMSLLFRHFLN